MAKSKLSNLEAIHRTGKVAPHSCISKMITVKLSASLFAMFKLAAEREGLNCAEEAAIIVSCSANLSVGDLRALSEPIRGHGRPDPSFNVELDQAKHFYEKSRSAELTQASIFRRILNDLLITQEIRISKGENEKGVLLQLAQLHFEYADDYEADGPIPLLSRQHRGQP